MAFVKFKPLTAELVYTNVIDIEKIDEQAKKLIIPSEKIFIVCKATRDLFVLTDKRILIIDFRGIRGFRKTVYSIPLKSIVSYDINIHNFDTKMDITTTSGYQLDIKFSKPIPLETMYEMYNYMSKHILNC